MHEFMNGPDRYKFYVLTEPNYKILLNTSSAT